ncbi:uncharacterized protein CTRU02_208705 [Colletotrichum truncatum]|uniref:Uncharacterized protein n=1 Tax=Colletotrichum truncatum TaxID=5467 RepID=A0ACC3YX10_COLTU|nr:uncharacterized protein CTRU02_06636 [Colletotrichum truncatum]KAF6792553.1 hypothetical protein CTRU02_06636 [Colletotrichum truncatum]
MMAIIVVVVAFVGLMSTTECASFALESQFGATSAVHVMSSTFTATITRSSLGMAIFATVAVLLGHPVSTKSIPSNLARSPSKASVPIA